MPARNDLPHLLPLCIGEVKHVCQASRDVLGQAFWMLAGLVERTNDQMRGDSRTTCRSAEEDQQREQHVPTLRRPKRAGR